MCSCLRCSPLAKSWLEGLQAGNWDSVGAPWAAAAAAEHQEPMAPPALHQLLTPLCSQGDLMGSKLFFSDGTM